MKRWAIHEGDCVALANEGQEHAFDAIVCDPPYDLVSITKRFGKNGSAPAKFGSDGRFARLSGGFMGQKWDSTGVAFKPETWAALLRVAKPGAHLIAFGGTRTWHRLVCAIEDAGWEIRDGLMWLYGTGFPKSHDVAQGIDKAARGVPQGSADPTSPNHGKYKGGCSEGNPSGRGFGAGPGQFMAEAGVKSQRELAEEAKQWDGWGTALKPAWESIICARKPLSLGWERNTIVSNLDKLEAQLWSLLPASIAEKRFGLSQVEHDAARASARWSTDDWANTRAGLSDLMVTSQFETVMSTCLNTVRSWRGCLDAILSQMNTSTTETESNLTTDLKTLNSYVSVLTPLAIVQAAMSPDGSRLSVLPVARCLSAVVEKWNAIHTLSALGSTTDKGRISHRGEDANLRPNWEPIVLARAPLSEPTIAANVLKWGTGAINVDGCRIEGAVPQTVQGKSEHTYGG